MSGPVRVTGTVTELHRQMTGGGTSFGVIKGDNGSDYAYNGASAARVITTEGQRVEFEHLSGSSWPRQATAIKAAP